MLGLILFWLTEHGLVPWHTFIAEYKFTFYLRTAVDTQKVGQRLRFHLYYKFIILSWEKLFLHIFKVFTIWEPTIWLGLDIKI